MNGPYLRSAAAAQSSTPRKAMGLRIQNEDDSSKHEIWSTLLDSVATSKKLPEKHVFVLGVSSFECQDSGSQSGLTMQSIGGTPDRQKQFIEALAQDASASRRGPARYASADAPVANQFALGYTYHDVMDADDEGTTPSWHYILQG